MTTFPTTFQVQPWTPPDKTLIAGSPAGFGPLEYSYDALYTNTGMTNRAAFENAVRAGMEAALRQQTINLAQGNREIERGLEMGRYADLQSRQRRQDAINDALRAEEMRRFGVTTGLQSRQITAQEKQAEALRKATADRFSETQEANREKLFLPEMNYAASLGLYRDTNFPEASPQAKSQARVLNEMSRIKIENDYAETQATAEWLNNTKEKLDRLRFDPENKSLQAELGSGPTGSQARYKELTDPKSPIRIKLGLDKQGKWYARNKPVWLQMSRPKTQTTTAGLSPGDMFFSNKGTTPTWRSNRPPPPPPVDLTPYRQPPVGLTPEVPMPGAGQASGYTGGQAPYSEGQALMAKDASGNIVYYVVRNGVPVPY